MGGTLNKHIKKLDELKDSRLLYDKKLPAFGYMILIIIAFLLVAVVIWSVYTPKMYIIDATGAVDSIQKDYVMSPYSGTITETTIKEGTLVDQGDVLFRVKSTELNLQTTQLTEQKKTYEVRISQNEKLVKSIKDDTNYFSINVSDDSLYYSQYETYKSKVAQSQVDVSTYKSYGYTDEQIEKQLVTNEAKITELYYSAITSAESAIVEAKTQLASIEAQMTALNQGKNEYEIKAEHSGIVHMMGDYQTGMVVQAASAVATISSQNDGYQIVANVSAQDAARVKVGDSVDIAVAGLTQSVYGTVKGTVTSVDTDLTTTQNSKTSESVSYFKINIESEVTYLISKAGNKVNLSTGMVVEARVQYDQVSYFNYVLEALGVLSR